MSDEQVQEQVEESDNVETDAILDAIKELTKQVVELTKIIKGMKESHDKWVRAGKF